MARCAVRAASSGAIPRSFIAFVPPAASQAGTSQRDVPTENKDSVKMHSFFGRSQKSCVNAIKTTLALAAWI
jgi:hypothetical protein